MQRILCFIALVLGAAAILSATGQRIQALPQADQLDVSTLTPGLYVLEADGQRARFVKE